MGEEYSRPHQPGAGEDCARRLTRCAAAPEHPSARTQLGREHPRHLSKRRSASACRTARALLAIPLEATALAAITTFDWDGSNELYSHIRSQWNGEDDLFDVGKLDALEACSGLKTLHFIGGAFRSIEPTAPLHP